MIKKKKTNWSNWFQTFVLFVAGYIGTYFALSYAIPSMRLSVDAMVENYFAENLQHLMFQKSTAAIAVGFVMAMIPRVLGKEK